MKQKILMAFIESGFGHISSMESIYNALCDKYSDVYDIDKCFIMHEDEDKSLMFLENFFIKQVQNTNKIPLFGKFIFGVIGLLGNDKVMRFFHSHMAKKSYRAMLQSLKKREPDVIITNHYFTNFMAVEYKRLINPDVVVINYNPDNVTHKFWDHRDGLFIVNTATAAEQAIKTGVKRENLREVTPCVRSNIAENTLTKQQLRDKFGLDADKFTVVIADGGYLAGRGPKFARAIIKSGLPITLCIIAGKNKKRYKEFSKIARGEGRIKVAPQMTVKVYEFLKNAHELYGAADLFLTKGGPNAVLDSIYMHTPVMINYCPQLMEEATVKYYIDMLGCGECAFTKTKAIKRIRELMQDDRDLFRYYANIDKFIAKGNGASDTADIVNAAAVAKRKELYKKGIVYDCDSEVWVKNAAESAKNILKEVSAESAPRHNAVNDEPIGVRTLE